jgi:hypothetical protein
MTGGAAQALSPRRLTSGKYHDDYTGTGMQITLDSPCRQDLAWEENRNVGERLVNRATG